MTVGSLHINQTKWPNGYFNSFKLTYINCQIIDYANLLFNNLPPSLFSPLHIKDISIFLPSKMLNFRKADTELKHILSLYDQIHILSWSIYSHGQDTRSIFKQSKADLNSVFFLKD